MGWGPHNTKKNIIYNLAESMPKTNFSEADERLRLIRVGYFNLKSQKEEEGDYHAATGKQGKCVQP